MSDRVALGDICEVFGGATPSKKVASYFEGSIPWATIRDMGEASLTDTEFKITQEALDSCSSSLIPSGNVVIATRVGLGKVCLLAQDTAINQDLRGLVPKDPSAVDRKYLFYAMKDLAPEIVASGSGATVQGVRLPFIKQLQITLPPLDDQRRIVATLDEALGEIGELKRNRQAKLEAFDDVKASILTELLQPNSGAAATEAWTEVPLANACSIDYGTRVVRKQEAGTEYPVYGGGGATFRVDKFNREDTVIVSRFAMSEQTTRAVRGKFFLNDSGLTVSTLDAGAVTQDFVNAWLLASSARIYSLGRGTAQRNLDVPAFREMTFRFPPLDEQRRIVATLDEADLAVDSGKVAATEELELADAMASSLMTELLTAA